MVYENEEVKKAAEQLKSELDGLSDKKSILRSPRLRSLFDELIKMPPEQRAGFGAEINRLKSELAELAETAAGPAEQLKPIDVTAPWDVNTPADKLPRLLPPEVGSRHPLMSELAYILDIFYRMGFSAVESRSLDNDFNMFGALNFPEGHPARDDYDTFVTEEGLIAPAHTSTMQNRVLKAGKADLEAGHGIRVVIPGRVFRNEDLDARHEHTFYQLEGVAVDKGLHVGNLMATLKTYLSEYFQKDVQVKTQPFYFPFTEPSFEFASTCPFCDQAGCQVCSYSGWIELLGCGMIHPNVLKMADIDPNVYTGFAWGGGIDRLVMIKYGIEDIRHFHSGKLEFLRQFK